MLSLDLSIGDDCLENHIGHYLTANSQENYGNGCTEKDLTFDTPILVLSLSEDVGNTIFIRPFHFLLY